jgi:hypothetical protein
VGWGRSRTAQPSMGDWRGGGYTRTGSSQPERRRAAPAVAHTRVRTPGGPGVHKCPLLLPHELDFSGEHAAEVALPTLKALSHLPRQPAHQKRTQRVLKGALFAIHAVHTCPWFQQVHACSAHTPFKNQHALHTRRNHRKVKRHVTLTCRATVRMSFHLLGKSFTSRTAWAPGRRCKNKLACWDVGVQVHTQASNEASKCVWGWGGGGWRAG